MSAPPDMLFDYLDDHARLGSHMQERSMMMLGGRMSYTFDAAKGRAVGSIIRMEGSVLGMRLLVEEVIVEHRAPHRKVWETRGHPNLLVIGSYRMGFEINASGASSMLRVFIDCNYPETAAGKIAGPIFGPIYARWCVNRMAQDAADRFPGDKT